MNFTLSRVIIFVRDTRTSAAFYRDHFGMLTVGEWSEEWAELESATGGCRLAFHRARRDGKPIEHSTGSPEHPHKIVFSVPDIEAARAALVERGVKMDKVCRVTAVPGFEFCDGTDPEGHRFQISTRR
jgi:catechol 2,3-dioxygenase-like lactoylglutathione lyase family enzyme